MKMKLETLVLLSGSHKAVRSGSLAPPLLEPLCLCVGVQVTGESVRSF